MEISDLGLFGQVGRWQERYYYSEQVNSENSRLIEQVENSGFLSMENYELHLYRFKDKNWLEFNKTYCYNKEFTPEDFYLNPMNYRIFLRKYRIK